MHDQRNKHESKTKQGDLIRTADIKEVFSKCQSTNCSYKLYTITEISYNTNLSY